MKNILLWMKRFDAENGEIGVRKKVILKTGTTAVISRIYNKDKDLVSIASDEVADIENATESFYNHKQFLN